VVHFTSNPQNQCQKGVIHDRKIDSNLKKILIKNSDIRTSPILFYSMDTSSNNNELCTLKALLRQEQTYFTQNYLERHHVVDQSSRLMMVQWSHKIVDHCELQRETVAIAMNYVDRFFSTRTGELMLQNRKHFQLACVAALYTAVKIHEQLAISPGMLASVSRGMHTAKDIQDMECVLVEALQWKLNPPISMTFVHEYIDIVTTLSTRQRQAVLKIARFQCDFAVENYDFVSMKPSILAFLALSNALKAIHLHVPRDLEKVVENTRIDTRVFIALRDKQNKLSQAAAKNIKKATIEEDTKNAQWLCEIQQSIECRRKSHNAINSPRCVHEPLRRSSYDEHHRNHNGVFVV
jgi:hypothetical protein